MAGPVQRRKAGDKAENMWASGELRSNPQTEEEWDKWEEFWALMEKADGKGVSDAFERGAKGGYETARSNYRDAVYETHYADTMSREQFDDLRSYYSDTPMGEAFRRGELGSDYEQLKSAGPYARSSKSEGEFLAKMETVKAGGQFDGITLPELPEMTPEMYKVGDKLDLQGFTLGDAGDSAWQDFAGQDSIDYFRGIMEGGGRDAVSEAEFQRRAAEAEMRDRAQREATMRAAETQGLSGSGVELASDLAGQQARTMALHQTGLDAAAMAQQRRDSAAGDVYGMEGDRANALDAWGMWDTNRHDTEAIANAELANDEARTNWGRQNFVSDRNTDLTNTAESYNIGLNQQNFGNEMSLAGAKSGAGFNVGNFLLGADQFNQNMDWNQYTYEDSKPGALETAMTVLGGVAGLGSTGAQLYSAGKKKT